MIIKSLDLIADHWKFLSRPDKYILAASGGDRQLVPASTRRQFQTAGDILGRLNGSEESEPRRGILLADDVGLGKTTIAALIAWIVARAPGSDGKRRTVRILAPNDVMVRRWNDELIAHLEPLGQCAPLLDAQAGNVVPRRVAALRPGTIQVVKHSYAARGGGLACDLLIVDEAHRAKGQFSNFNAALNQKIHRAKRVLILSATPFSIQPSELNQMLKLIGAGSVSNAVNAFSNELKTLYKGGKRVDAAKFAQQLVTTSQSTVSALAPVVIRHGIDDLPLELKCFGKCEEWRIDVPEASGAELELLLRMDRALRLMARHDAATASMTNDPRFHVGWNHFGVKLQRLQARIASLDQPHKATIEHHCVAITALRKSDQPHPKVAAIASEVGRKAAENEKVVVFCHHMATVIELTHELNRQMPLAVNLAMPGIDVWVSAWEQILGVDAEMPAKAALRDSFKVWIVGKLIRDQTWHWLTMAGKRPLTVKDLVKGLKTTKARKQSGRESIANAALHLFKELSGSKSTRAVLDAAKSDPGLLPGGEGCGRVLGICDLDHATRGHLFMRNNSPDTAIKIFNSPFGPDALVVTDKMSEGIDLHRYCRHLIHYELDPSPIRVIQRNGRIRRVDSWAAVTRTPVLYAYPAFGGTRDHKLVRIVKNRIDSFSLLLGGVQDFDVDETDELNEHWRNEVISIAKKKMQKSAGQLCVTVDC